MTQYDFLKDSLPTELVEKMQAAAKARSIKCPKCGAGAGRNCRMDVRSDVHPERLAAINADEERIVTIEEARALPGLLGVIASAMLQRHGTYGFTDDTTGRKVLLRLAR